MNFQDMIYKFNRLFILCSAWLHGFRMIHAQKINILIFNGQFVTFVLTGHMASL